MRYLLDNLDKNKYKMFAFISNKDGHYKNMGETIETIINNPSPLIAGNQPIYKLINIAIVLKNIIYHIFQMKKFNIKVVHTNNNVRIHLAVIIASKLLNIRSICHIHDQRELTKIEKHVIKFADAVIVLTNESKNLYATSYNKRITVIPNGLKIDDYIDLNFNEEAKYIKNPSVAIVGRLEEWKGQEIFIKSLPFVKKSFNDIIYYIVGDNKGCDCTYKNRLLAMVNALNIQENIVFLGWIDDPKAIMSKVDLTVCSSIEPEPFGFVVIESMAVGTPVIATRHGGPLEIIKEGYTGYLYSPRDYEELSKHIIFILSNRDELNKMSDRCVDQIINLFNITDNIKLVMALYDEK